MGTAVEESAYPRITM
jgi:hypothetical protein